MLSGNTIENFTSLMHLITEEENEDESSSNKEYESDKNQIIIQDVSDRAQNSADWDIRNIEVLFWAVA